ncbi:hypothetical protein NDS46_31510 (plasmid) [Paenibacillus thiaminolyticus]|uniref:hypothetical protein n=1 Tax=Paenibacillus thiaminolyticus TaxID=49283 RepID=UPI00232F86AA|nr:hypothetical protein [Paenibacillus thiaminolyticus]WCF11486.1 hypothetical protein NDS46_31510 [Paenibacillus thiaminolyticus]
MGKMKRFNVYFEFDNEVEIGVIVETSFDHETERKEIIDQARLKLLEKSLKLFSNLKCTEVNYLEDV